MNTNNLYINIKLHLYSILEKYTGNKILVICGDSTGVLGYKLNCKTLSMDISPAKNPLSEVLKFSYIKFPFSVEMIPLFIYPSLDGCSVDSTIKYNIKHLKSFLYIDMPRNLNGNLDHNAYKIKHIYPNWLGYKKEKIFEMTEK